MVKRLLIDATHNEEVRIAVVNGSLLEEFDSETANKRQIKSNIYLAKVIRVEPSLQAAFVEYNGGRHGFLPFAEIHPDYYRIPVADRHELEQSLAADMANDSTLNDRDTAVDGGSEGLDVTPGLNQDASVVVPEAIPETEEKVIKSRKRKVYKAEAALASIDEKKSELIDIVSMDAMSEDSLMVAAQLVEPLVLGDMNERDVLVPFADDLSNDMSEHLDNVSEQPDNTKTGKNRLRFRYKIQEVIKRRQILLVQVVKEERGNKGAALTTYLSLPGRYCVLMPNAGHRAGGVSRKINDNEDRRRLRDLMKEFEIPDGMSLIVRTAGQERNKSEIRRDYEYLLRVWDDIREKTINSIAPELVYAEGDLVQRAIRDVYDRDIEEILVEGDDAHKAARAFMKSLIPSHVKKVKLYKDLLQPIFHRFHVEEQIEKMHEPAVSLPSGGSIVINHTEALIAIDVNSGKSTRERNIDDTALKTNLEAATEISRQLRLRDIGGLIVVDFIDMHDNAHIAQVERKMRDALKTDRARIQVGRISQFGLLEFSRQRLRPSLLESHSITCGHCKGSGLIRSVDSMALQILRDIERIAILGTAYDILVAVPDGIDLFLLNQKRSTLVQIETRFGVRVTIERGHTLLSPSFRLTVLSDRPKALRIAEHDTHSVLPSFDSDLLDDIVSEGAHESVDDAVVLQNPHQEKRHGRRRRPNRRGGRDNRLPVLSENGDVIESSDAVTIIAEPIDNEKDATPVVESIGGARTEHHVENRNPNRRRRHPYQRRQHARDNSQSGNNDTSSIVERPIKIAAEQGVPPSGATKASSLDVVPMKRDGVQSPKPVHNRVPREPKKESSSGQESGAEGQGKKSKSWIRRLLDV